MFTLEVCFVGEYDPELIINRTTIERLEQNNVKITPINVYSKKFAGSQKLSKILFISSVLKQKSADIFHIPCPVRSYAFIVKLFSLLLSKPLVIDFLASDYMNRRYEFNLYKKDKIRKFIDYWHDKLTLQLSDLILVDTPGNLRWFSETFKIDKKKFFVKYFGESTDIFKPLKIKKPGRKFKVLYFLGYLPLHNMPYVLQVVKILENENIFFTFVGDGPKRKESEIIAKEQGLKNIKFVDHVQFKKIAQFLNDCDVCLGGPFGHTEKAKRIITTKTFTGLASQKPVIVGRTEETEKFFKENPDAAVFVDIYNPKSLAGAIVRLKKNSAYREKVARKGYAFFKKNFSSRKLGEGLVKAFKSL